MKIYLDDGAIMPTRAHETDAGLDLYSREGKYIYPGMSEVFDTGVHVELPERTCGLLVSKSGLNVKMDITSTGLIDEGYNGSIRVKLYNHGSQFRYIRRGDKISQLVILLYCVPEIEAVNDLQEFTETDRGADGFGSTGR